MATEADTCRKFVVPKLQAAGWDNEPHSIAEQRYFTAGRIVSHGPAARRRAGKRADYLLRYTRDLPLAVVEAKAGYKHATDGLQQSKDYATILGFPFAYATNGAAIIEFDFLTGKESEVADFPTPAELWARYSQKQQLSDPVAVERFLAPFIRRYRGACLLGLTSLRLSLEQRLEPLTQLYIPTTRSLEKSRSLLRRGKLLSPPPQLVWLAP